MLIHKNRNKRASCRFIYKQLLWNASLKKTLFRELTAVEGKQNVINAAFSQTG